ncbi:thiamine pyrophosphokinase [Zalerion maritima]|uniref:Thiamine pyrophosphokinase n=1 Tax=Zalerion maritima TaxID=339359 RepID=A0AAD5RSV7_9PEZI|nr:thiamine pyrophosphokinase [Zalerion maritima]
MEFEWHPLRFLQQHHASGSPGQNPLALIVLNQPLSDLFTLNRIWNNSLLHVAADGGANRLLTAQRRAKSHPSDGTPSQEAPFTQLQVVIGDLDSLTEETKTHFAAQGTKVIHDSDQESTDFGKAVNYIRSRSDGTPVDIVAMGGLGGRVDQGLSQLHHLYLFQKGEGYPDGRLYLVSGEAITFLLKAGHHRIHVREGSEETFGQHVGIIPIGEPSVITTSGLEWDVEEWETHFGGRISTSNHILPETRVVEVSTSKDVIFTIALRDRGFNVQG